MNQDSKKEIVITRIFDAPIEKVWQAWTDPELIQKWWGPEGFSAPSIKVDLRVGGKYIYAMHGPQGSQWDKDMYSSGIFREIVPPGSGSGKAKIVVTDYFSDEQGNKLPPADFGQSPDFPDESAYTILFEDIGDGKTKLSLITPEPETQKQYEAMLKSGMVDGWNSSLNKMEEAIKHE